MANHVYRGSQSLLDVQGEENTPAAKNQELVATLSVESEQQEEQQEQRLAALLTVEETRQTDEEQQRLVALLDVQETREEDTRTQEVIALLDVLDEVPPIPVNPPQGLQAELELIYLYNPDAANSLIQELNLTIEEVNDAVQDITQLTVDAMKIKPYSLLGEPIAQNTPCTFDGCIYVAVATIAQKDPVFNPAQWAKVGTADYNKLYNKPDFITRSDLSCTATGLTYSQETGVLSLTSGYVIPTVAKISQIDTGIATNATNLTLETQQREEAVSNANARINALETGLTAETTDRVAADSSMANNISSLNGRLVAHETNHNNPHQVTKAQIGLGNVNNTADLDKPISTATQQALNALSGRIGTTDAKFDDYRTAAQQDILDNQIRIEISNVSQAVTLEEAARLSADATINNKINSIEEVIPSSATASNMLADRAFVNSSINNMAAYYITASASGNAFGDHARLISGPWYFQGELRTPTMNDYALVIEDETHDNKSARYLYDGAQWAFQYTLNNTEFTQDQINAINSTITKGKVDAYDAHIINYSNPHNVTKAQVGLSNVDNTSDLNKPVSTATQQALAQKQDIINDLATIRAGAALGATAVQPADLTAYETTAHASATYQLKGDYATTSAMNVALAGKQNVLTAGTGVTIENDVISVTFPSTIAWGNITGNITDQIDLMNKFSEYVKTDGSSTMTAPLKFMAGSMRGAVGPYLNGVSFWKMSAQQVITNIANLTDSQFLPVTTNSIDLGRSANKWKDLYLAGKAYVATLNNGADLSVPNKSGTLATTADVELAARSGRMLTDQGVWYAKMYAATVAPSAENGTNYADFSQVDGQGNPIIVIYKRQNGAWVQSETITPPSEYDGYVPITSKIWDIPEQAGQQGGRILWNHQSKEFTPYPTIISFEDIEITGNSTVIIPLNPTSNQIVNKDYVDSHIPTVGNGTITITQGGTTKGTFTTNQGGNTTIDLDSGGAGHNVGDIFFTMRNDNGLNGAVECNGATYNTTDFTGTESIGELLEAGKLDYISLTDYATAISTKGWCDKIGWNGTGTTSFRVPTLTPHIIQQNNIPVKGTGITLGLTNGNLNTGIGTGWNGNGFVVQVPNSYGEPIGYTDPTGAVTDGKSMGVTTDPTKSGIIADTSDTAQLRVMIQIADGATDEALETCTGVLADVAALKYDYVVDFQAPTAQNNYTWYRKYKSGWVEQGGVYTGSLSAGNSAAITLTVTMSDTNYTLNITGEQNSNNYSYAVIADGSKTTTGFSLFAGGASSGDSIKAACWQVSGMAAE